MSNISVLVGLYNNLDYTQHFYSTFREVYPTVELVFISYGSTDDTGIWLNLIESIDPNVIVYWENKRKTFSDTYNKAIELATKDFVVFAHNDMVVAPGFLENLEKVKWEPVKRILAARSQIEIRRKLITITKIKTNIIKF